MKEKLEDYTAEEIRKYDEVEATLTPYNKQLRAGLNPDVPQITDELMDKNSKYRALLMKMELAYLGV